MKQFLKIASAAGGFILGAGCMSHSVLPQLPTTRMAKMISQTIHPSTATAPPGRSHVLDADAMQLYTSTTTNFSKYAPYLTYAYTSSVTARMAEAAGIKVIGYTNPLQPVCQRFSRSTCVAGDYTGYNYLKPGGKYASLASRNCSGQVSQGNYRGYPSYQLDVNANLSSTSAYFNAVEAANGHRANITFIDNAGPRIYGTSQQQCNTSSASVYANDAKIVANAASYGPYLVNALDMTTISSEQEALQVLNAADVIGAEMEECYGGEHWNSAWHKSWAADLGRFPVWLTNEYGEINTIAKHKMFFCLNRFWAPSVSYIPQRLYMYASFLLTYDPSYGVYEEEFTTPSKFEVYPEQTVVPEYATTTASDVSGYLQRGGAYARAFNHCYIKGSYEGACMVVVNPSDTATVPVPSGYTKRLVLSGAGVLDGGTATVSTGAPTTLGPVSAAIIFR